MISKELSTSTFAIISEKKFEEESFDTSDILWRVGYVALAIFGCGILCTLACVCDYYESIRYELNNPETNDENSELHISSLDDLLNP